MLLCLICGLSLAVNSQADLRTAWGDYRPRIFIEEYLNYCAQLYNVVETLGRASAMLPSYRTDHGEQRPPSLYPASAASTSRPGPSLIPPSLRSGHASMVYGPSGFLGAKPNPELVRPSDSEALIDATVTQLTPWNSTAILIHVYSGHVRSTARDMADCILATMVDSPTSQPVVVLALFVDCFSAATMLDLGHQPEI
ncbi:hypothetical protein CCHR01_17594 [Colletotrichum chrysophilum]|uniref:Uncharacterized protein n=1 Tax=Colletotrichum chrysophilum TaxID=1836956 RepID=A0AAD9A1V1_9PEZI|nr:hypothetical protein CCHR01_17594 [Colletotrichum chrysophilum]